ncbi:MAG: FAD-binding oxidoreductase [Butyribacter sp.]|nr:FAD-binding oxidoreductase [bacterium]MDY3854623.1 FAD-binding oxidoreductase [Butyribacter sp.]
MKQTADVIVIGGGIVGCAAAYYLAKKKTDVIVLEASDSIGHGGSSRNGGGVRQSGRDPRELPYAMYGIEHLWPTLSEELGMDVEYCQGGNLRLALNDEHIEILKARTADATALGLDVTMVDAKEVKEICPHLSDKIVAASWCPTDGHANPMLTTLAYYRRAREMGVTFITGEPVVELRKIKGKIRQVVSKDGTIYEAENVIVAAGYEGREIARTVGIDIPMTRFFEECVVTEMQPKMFDIMLGVATAEVYGHQCAHGSFVFGSGTGMESANDRIGALQTSALGTPANCRAIMKYVPALGDAKIVRSWGGWMDITHDKVPVISTVDEVPGLILAIGFSGHGFGTGPVVGLMLSQMVLGEKTACDLSALRYNRFKSKV